MKANNFHLLVDSSEFIDDLENRILNAADRVLIQAMTFEADTAGLRLYDALKNSQAREKILCVDAYSLVNVNDGWAYGWQYLTNREHRREVDETRRILRSSNEFGIQVVLTNPLGFMGLRYPFRNHKKLMVVDDVAYLGGINFSEHNFSWHDFMVRISDEKIVEVLGEDFQFTSQRRNQSAIKEVDSGKLYFLNGTNSKKEYGQLFEEVRSAKKSITILSPYVSDPLLSILKTLDSELEVKIVTSKQNNKSLFKHGLYGAIKGSNYKLYEYQPVMSHLKAILIDDSKLIFGSCNFDVVSYYLEQEVVMVSEDEHLIESFRERILRSDISNSEEVDLTNVRRHLWARIAMILLKKSVAILAFFFTQRPDDPTNN